MLVWLQISSLDGTTELPLCEPECPGTEWLHCPLLWANSTESDCISIHTVQFFWQLSSFSVSQCCFGGDSSHEKVLIKLANWMRHKHFVSISPYIAISTKTSNFVFAQQPNNLLQKTRETDAHLKRQWQAIIAVGKTCRGSMSQRFYVSRAMNTSDPLKTKMHTNNAMIRGLLTNKCELGFDGKVSICFMTKGRSKVFSVVDQRPGKWLR